VSTVANLKQVLVKVRGDAGLAELPDSASILTDVALDSLELLQFMLEVEVALTIVIDFERLDYEHLDSLTTLAAFFDTMPQADGTA
jgi:acyl carrier protein